MANHKTGAQRYNDRMDKIFDRAKKEGRGLVGNSGLDNLGVNSPAMKAYVGHATHTSYGDFMKSVNQRKAKDAKQKALNNRKESKKAYTKRHGDDLLKYETN